MLCCVFRNLENDVDFAISSEQKQKRDEHMNAKHFATPGLFGVGNSTRGSCTSRSEASGLYVTTTTIAFHPQHPTPDQPLISCSCGTEEQEEQMASKSQTSTKRLLKELSNHEREPSDALLHLSPISDDDLTRWTAVMKGVPGTAYEGKRKQNPIAVERKKEGKEN